MSQTLQDPASPVLHPPHAAALIKKLRASFCVGEDSMSLATSSMDFTALLKPGISHVYSLFRRRSLLCITSGFCSFNTFMCIILLVLVVSSAACRVLEYQII